jgi:hypothetical protein
MLKFLLDPAAVPFLPLSVNPNTLLRQANQAWIQAFDHVTALPKQISAALCRLSTGAGFNLPVRGSLITISVGRPILMTVPTDVTGAAWNPTSDLLHHMLTVTLPPLTEQTNRPETEIVEKFLHARPKILGALAQAVSVAMGRVDRIQLASYPKNAEAAVWVIAAAPALNTTEESLQQVLKQQSQFVIPKDPLVQKIAVLMASRDDWQGTATKLSVELNLSIAPNHLSRRLKKVQPILLDQGIEIAFPPRQVAGQLIRFTKVHKPNEVSNSESAADIPVGTDDSGSRREPSMTVPPIIDRHIVRAEQNKEETITLRLQPDCQALLPAATATAAPAELPARAGAKEADPEVIQAASVTTILVGSIDSMPTQMTVSPEIHRIVSAERHKEETSTVPRQPDRQAPMPAGAGTAPPEELPRRGAMEPEEASKSEAIVESMQELAAVTPDRNNVSAPPGWH